MANEKNIKDSIEVLKRVRDRNGKFDLSNWQENAFYYSKVLTAEEELHTCEMAACIGGWIAVSPEFHSAGGSLTHVGFPRFNGYTGFGALVEYWGVPMIEVELRCDTDQFTMEYYGVDSLREVTIDMVIKAVESLLDLPDAA